MGLAVPGITVLERHHPLKPTLPLPHQQSAGAEASSFAVGEIDRPRSPSSACRLQVTMSSTVGTSARATATPAQRAATSTVAIVGPSLVTTVRAAAWHPACDDMSVAARRSARRRASVALRAVAVPAGGLDLGHVDRVIDAFVDVEPEEIVPGGANLDELRHQVLRPPRDRGRVRGHPVPTTSRSSTARSADATPG